MQNEEQVVELSVTEVLDEVYGHVEDREEESVNQFINAYVYA